MPVEEVKFEPYPSLRSTVTVWMWNIPQSHVFEPLISSSWHYFGMPWGLARINGSMGGWPQTLYSGPAELSVSLDVTSHFAWSFTEKVMPSTLWWLYLLKLTWENKPLLPWAASVEHSVTSTPQQEADSDEGTTYTVSSHTVVLGETSSPHNLDVSCEDWILPVLMTTDSLWVDFQ